MRVGFEPVPHKWLEHYTTAYKALQSKSMYHKTDLLDEKINYLEFFNFASNNKWNRFEMRCKMVKNKFHETFHKRINEKLVIFHELLFDHIFILF